MFIQEMDFDSWKNSNILENCYKREEKRAWDVWIQKPHASFEEMKPYEERLNKAYEEWRNSLIREC